MSTQTRKNILIALSYSAVLILGMYLGPRFFGENSNRKNGSFFTLGGRSEKMDRILQLVRDNYVDKIETDSLQDSAIAAILAHLDPHSSYLPPVEARLMTDNLEGNYFGIGIEYYVLADSLLVTSVTENSPAAKSGLQKGDRIIGVDGKRLKEKDLSGRNIVGTIRGKRGSTVKLGIIRKGRALSLAVVRDKITVSSIDAAYLLNSKTGYIKISRFGSQTDEDFKEAISKLLKSGMQDLVLDLRDNGGGYLNAATALADEFLGEKKLIVYTQGANEPRTDYFASREGSFEKGRLVVLINENSASASEILAGAMQDLDRGTIIGRRSFGKGLVQEQFNFGDGSALNLTIARYYTPSGRSIQKSYVKGADEYYREVGNRFRDGEAVSGGKSIPDSIYDKKKPYKTSSGRTVYGGGGIMPDVYIPLDTLAYTRFYTDVIRKGVLNEFVYSRLVNQVPRLTVSQFVDGYSIPLASYEAFIAFARERKVESSETDSARSGAAIRADMKSLLARYLYGAEAYYRVLNKGDEAIARSINVFTK